MKTPLKNMPLVEAAFEKANRAAQRGSFSAEKLAREAHDLRRELAANGHEPKFPTNWGEPLAKFWITNAGTGEHRHLMRPEVDLHLTIWRFQDFEATVTFDRFWFQRTRAGEELGWRKVPPPTGGWEEAGTTDHHSTLWTRPLAKKGGAQ